VFAAAVTGRVSKVVWASSETVLGLPFDTPPDFAPIDETIEPRPETSYALSKIVGEDMARQFARRSGVPFIGLRFSNIMEPNDYQSFPTFWDDPHLRRWNLWGYVDVRDVATSVLLAIEADVTGAEVCIVAASDTVMTRPSSELMAEVYPAVPMRRPVEGRETLLAIDRARSVLGYEPEHSWEDHLG
jgi:nucleoside-diphosphate-sugar epimerase